MLQAEICHLVLALVVLCVYAWQARQYVPIWQTDEKLWTHVDRMYPMRVAIAYLNLGVIERRKGNNEAALQYYESVLVIDSDNISALVNRARTNMDLGNHELAITLFRDLTESHRDSLLAQNMSAIAMRRLGKLELTAEYFHQAYRLAPTSELQLYESSMADYSIGKYDRAMGKIESLLQLNNQHPRARTLNVALLFNRGFSREANLQLDALQKEFPNDPQIQEFYDQLKSQLAQ